ncbi:hypothetical protein M758_1G019500 [Ceratodon purpureus]|uniref:Uncharacterized protein n=1 Tax=Ceratodon purpureus TaxID=3225 RepID=A0A8T0J2I7_CERPU|nr:hypothetical protein KC19_1G020900 [Ceratodon purpureus]KAG0628342.1 hypothetical protein M758_1G019500 [Ceratodon purpureus]
MQIFGPGLLQPKLRHCDGPKFHLQLSIPGFCPGGFLIRVELDITLVQNSSSGF